MEQRNPGLKPWAILLSHFMATPFTAFNHSRRSRSFSDFTPSELPAFAHVVGIPGVLARSRRSRSLSLVTHHSIAV